MKQHRNRTAAEPAYCTCNSTSGNVQGNVKGKNIINLMLKFDLHFKKFGDV